jgi:hypothetical protein
MMIPRRLSFTLISGIQTICFAYGTERNKINKKAARVFISSIDPLRAIYKLQLEKVPIQAINHQA